MANKKSTTVSTKKVVKSAAKMAKKNPKGFAILLVIVLVLVAAGVAGYFIYRNFNPDVVFALKGGKEVSVALNSAYVDKGVTATYNGKDVSSEVVMSYYLGSEKKDSINTETETTYKVEYTLDYQKYSGKLERTVNVTDVAQIDINFLELGVRNTGDSTFIKAGDADILIDAGAKRESSSTIISFIDTYCTDGILEYVIATHAHEDHISGFVGPNNKNQGVFDKYKVDTLIDYAKSDSTSKISQDYASLRDKKLASGDIAHHYTANDCVQEQNGAKKVFDIAPGITMEILDQKYYRQKASTENDYSVCALFTQGENHYLFTGDLEEHGEASLVELNPTLPEVELFKGGHHGSYTANTDTLLSVIKPKTICICCCAGTSEYTKDVNSTHNFPAQEAIDRMGKWTDKIYVTTLMKDYNNGVYESMNGNINFHCAKGKEYTVTGSNNSVILKDTEWFKNNRTWPNS